MNFLLLSLVVWILAPKCSGCVVNSDCTTTTNSECSLGLCEPCTSSTSCSQFSLETVCKLNDRCVECLQSSDCSTLQPNCVSNNCVPCADDTLCASSFPSIPYCNVANNTCVECVNNNHCTSVNKSVCSPYGCSPCSQSNDCVHLPSTPICSSTGICVQNLPEKEGAYVIAAKAIEVVGKAIGYASMVSAASSFLLGGKQIFTLRAGIQLMTIPNFLNVYYPKNLQQLLDMAFINIDSWINPFQLFRFGRLDTPKRISDKGYDKNFIRANGGYLLFFTCSLVVHLLATKYIEKFSEKNKKIVTMLNKRFGFNSGFKFLVSNSLLFFLPVVLELKNTTPSAILTLSWLGSLITLAFYVYIPIKTNLTLSKIRKMGPEERKETLEKKKYLYEDFMNVDKTNASPFLGTMLILNAFQIIFIVGLYNIPPLQVGSLVLLDIIHLRLLTTEKPYTDPKTQKFQVSIQILLLTIKSLILIFVCTLNDEIDGQGNFRITFGWIVGGLCGAFLLTFQVKSLASTLPQLWKVMKRSIGRFWKVVKKFFEQKPVTPDEVVNQPQAQASQQDHIISESASAADSESYAKRLTENGQEVTESSPTKSMNFQKSQVDLDITDPEMDNSYAKLNKDNSFPDLRRSATTNNLSESPIFKRTKVYHMDQTSLNISTHMKPSGADSQN